MKLRKAGPADAPALVELFAVLAEQEGGVAPGEVDRAALARSVARFTDPPDGGGDGARFVLLAEPADGGPCLGALSVQRLAGILPGRPHFLVGDVSTATAARRRGVARRLLQEVERLAREADCARIDLHVPTVNIAALTLVARAGYGKEPDIHLTRVLVAT